MQENAQLEKDGKNRTEKVHFLSFPVACCRLARDTHNVLRAENVITSELRHRSDDAVRCGAVIETHRTYELIVRSYVRWAA